MKLFSFPAADMYLRNYLMIVPQSIQSLLCAVTVGNVQRIDKPRKHLAAYPFHRLHVSDKLFWNLFHNFQRNINSMPLGILQNFLQRFPQVRLIGFTRSQNGSMSGMNRHLIYTQPIRQINRGYKAASLQYSSSRNPR